MSWILVIIDDADIATMFSLFLLKHGYQVICVENVTSAIQVLAQVPIHLVILKPHASSLIRFDFIRTLNHPDRAIPLLVMTYVDERSTYLSGYLVDFITHPFDIDEMRLRIRSLLSKATATHPNDEA